MSNNIKVCILTVFFNTKHLFYPLYESFCRHNLDFEYHFEIYDNSTDDNKRLPRSFNQLSNVSIHYINQSIYQDLPQHNGSAKHTKTIDLALSELQTKYDYCILLDSDVIITSPILPYIEAMQRENATLCGYHDVTYNRNLIHPCAMIINLHHIKAHNIKFFDRNRMYGLHPHENTYDTGMSFYEDVLAANLTVKQIPYNDFAHHFGAGSRNYTNAGKVQSGKIYRNLTEWLNDFSVHYHYNHTILSNCCIGGFLDRLLCKAHNTPFVWNTIPSNSMQMLMTKLPQINLNNIVLRPIVNKPLNKKYFSILVDNEIQVEYPHYIWDPSLSSPRKTV